jgi:hypothetical protein
MDKSEIEALLARIDIWLLIFGIIVVIGVAGESFFGIRHWWNSRKLQTIQQTDELNLKAEIARLGNSAAEAKERAAQAEVRVAEANLELAKLKTPRTLNAEQQKRIAEKLKPFTGKQFDIALLVEPETQDLLPQIEGALKAAGWVEINWKGGGSIAEMSFTRKDRPNAGIVAVTGVIIQMHPEQIRELGTAANALASALSTEGVAAQAQSGLGVTNGNSQAIHILIGRKPQ